MTCCHCQATERQFDDAFARRDLKRYGKKGPDKTTRLMLEAIRSLAPAGGSLLDVGGGIGVLHHELLDEMVSTATHVEASSAFLEVASDESKRRGHAERVAFRHGDFVDLAPDLPAADLVALDRVICCYPELDRLVGLSAARASQLYLASYPRWRWIVRLGNALENAIRRVKGDAFRTFVHPVAEIEALLERNGLRCCFRRRTLIWEVVAFRPATVAQ